MIKHCAFAKTFLTVIPGLMVMALAFSAAAQDTNFNFQATQAAADKGDAKAQYDLARFYERSARGQGYFKAAHYARMSAMQGYTPAEVLLGSYYGRGLGLGMNMKMAMQWYRKAAGQGDAVAQFAVGNFYCIGRGTAVDTNQAVEWWQKAADQNEPDAEARLGQLYLLPEQPFGANYTDYPKGVVLLRRAAAQGSAEAMNNLGMACEMGLGVTHDFKQAAKWYQAAAERGNARAQANLGELYLDGRGVPSDLVQAYKWFKLSAVNGDFLGSAGFSHFQSERLLTPKQLGDAEQLVVDYHPISGGFQE